MKKILILASVFAYSTFVSAGEVVALESIIPAEIEVSFQTLDLNRDGVVTLNEAKNNKALVDAFSKLDLDKTGDLTTAEFSHFFITEKS